MLREGVGNEGVGDVRRCIGRSEIVACHIAVLYNHMHYLYVSSLINSPKFIIILHLCGASATMVTTLV